MAITAGDSGMISSCYPCQIIARSSDVPIVGAGLHYTIRMFLPDAVRDVTMMKPQRYYRESYVEQGVVLIPFDLGMRLICTVIRDGDREIIDIQAQEVPGQSPCED